ncbi:MAG: DNA adenine methylase [Flagellimonas sp.]
MNNDPTYHDIAEKEALDLSKKYEGKKIKKVSPPFGYFGSKNKIALELCSHLPPHFCWVETFCGSSSITLAKKPAAIEIINDIDDEIINVFRQLRDNQEELYRAITLTPYARKELELARIQNENDSELERARKFLVQAMMAINGVFGVAKGGFSYSQSYSRDGKDARVNRWTKLPERLSKVVERLRCVRIENRDALELISMFQKRPATLMYLDPPYLGKRTMGYNKENNDIVYHEQMLKLCIKSKSMVLISGYESELYTELLTEKRGWLKRTINTSTKDATGKSHSREEVLWMNEHFVKASKSGKVPIQLTQKELISNKVNPER